MCFCCQIYSSHTGSGAAVIAPASPTHKGRRFLQDTVLKWSFTWVLLPHKQETKDAVKWDREIRLNTQLGLIWDLETDVSTTKKVRGSETWKQWETKPSQCTGGWQQPWELYHKLGCYNFTRGFTTWQKKVEETQISKMSIIPVAFM